MQNDNSPLAVNRGENRSNALIDIIEDVTVYLINEMQDVKADKAKQFGGYSNDCYTCDGDYGYYAYSQDKFKKATVDLTK